jgi:hypothetical protein
MPNKYCNLNGANIIKTDFENINKGFAAVEVDTKKALDHMAGTYGKHDAAVIDYTGKVTTAANVKKALDDIKTEIDAIIGGDANAEVGQAHVSDARSGKVYDTIKQRFEDIEKDVVGGAKVDYTLTWGYNKIRNIGNSPVYFNFSGKGQHYVNLLGKDGDFEQDSNNDGILDNWEVQGAYAAVAVETHKYFGNRSARFTSDGGGNAYLTKDIAGLDPTKTYILSAYCYISAYVAGSPGVSIADYQTFNGQLASYTDTSKIGQWQRIGIKFTGRSNVRITMCSFSTNLTCYFDGAMLNAVASEDGGLSVDQLLAKYPYGESFVCTRNPSFEVRRGNLVRNGNGEEGVGGWITLNNSKLEIEGGKFKLSHPSLWMQAYQLINVKPNTDYYIQCNITSGSVSSGTIRIYDEAGSILVKQSYTNGTFNTSNYSKIMVSLTTADPGYFYFDSVMLVEGTTPPAEYKPCDRKIFSFDRPFTSNDTFGVENGKITGLLGQKHVVLFGKDYDWELDVDAGAGADYIRLSVPIRGSVSLTKNAECIKYDGKPLTNEWWTTYFWDSAADRFFLYNGNMYLDILRENAGWSHLSSPNIDERKAFMDGWKAALNVNGRYAAWTSVVDGSEPTGQYMGVADGSNGVGQKIVGVTDGSKFAVGGKVVYFDGMGGFEYNTIASIAGNSLTMTNNLTVACPTGNSVVQVTDISYVKNNIAPGYEGYQLHYKLNNPEPLNDINCPFMGELWNELTVGDNYVFMDCGTVLGTATFFKNKTESIIAVYKNGIYDPTCIIEYPTDLTYINGKASISWTQANFDPNATYTVDYTILRTKAPQAIGTVSGSYKTDLATGMSNVMAAVEEKQQRSTALDIIDDLAVYEEGSFNYDSFRATRTWNAQSAQGYIQIPIKFKVRKNTIPQIYLSNVSLKVLDSSGVSTIIRVSDCQAGAYANIRNITKDGFNVSWTINQGTLSDNAVNCGVEVVSLNWKADCKGVL